MGFGFGSASPSTPSVPKVTGKDDYKFGDLTKGALKSVTGKDEYQFGDISKSLFRKLTGGGDPAL